MKRGAEAGSSRSYPSIFCFPLRFLPMAVREGSLEAPTRHPLAWPLAGLLR
jgi:hypothetical protein